MTTSPEPVPTVAFPHARKLIFVSYASQDREAAERLTKEVEDRGMPCWLAPRDVPFGSNFGAAIIDAIETTEVFVVLLSANANNSLHVANEIERAVNYRKTIIPLRLENVLPSRPIELHISARQWVDLFDSKDQREHNMRRFLDALRNVLRSWLVPDLPPLQGGGPPDLPPSVSTVAPQHPTPPTTGPVVESDPMSVSQQTTEPKKDSIPPKSPAGSLPVSDPAIREAIEREIQAVQMTGDPNSRLGGELYKQYGPQAVVELCSVSKDSKDYWDRVRALSLLTRLAAQPAARNLAPVVLGAYENAFNDGAHQQSYALDGIQQLPISPREKWSVLINLLSVGQNSQLVEVLARITPKDQIAKTGDAIAEQLHFGHAQFRYACLAALKTMGATEVASVLRDILGTTTDSAFIAQASRILADWGDQTSCTSIRSALDIALSFTSGQLAETLWSLYRLEGSACADFVAGTYLDAKADIQTELLNYATFREIAEPAVIKAVETIASGTSTAALKNAAAQYFAAVRRK